MSVRDLYEKYIKEHEDEYVDYDEFVDDYWEWNRGD